MSDQPFIPSVELDLQHSEKKSPGKRLAEIPWWFLAIILIAIGAAYIIFTKDFLFSVPLNYAELDASQVSGDLVAAFEENDLKLAEDATVTVQKAGQRWHIADGKNTYIVELDGDQLDVYANSSYYEAFDFIKAGLTVTIQVSITAYSFAIILGLMAGMGRISKNVIFNNLARLYVELIRGIPMLVLIFFIALVGVPAVIELAAKVGLEVDIKNISMSARAIVALAVTYGAFLAEIFRAGIQSIGRGQMEAARSLGMSYSQAMRHVILPQAIRNVLPALGNDFVAMVKDSSLVSVLAVRDITQMARLYAGTTFRFRESYITLSVMYLTITVLLSLLVQLMERRLRKND